MKSEAFHPATVRACVGKVFRRVEERPTTRWYELSHDSHVRPILKANGDWRATNLTHAQKAADTWAENGKPDGLLLTGDDLTAAGHKPGPMFRRMLDAAYDAPLEGRVTTREEAMAVAVDA